MGQRDQLLIDELQSICEQYKKVVLASSLGVEDMLLTHIIAQQKIPISIFTLDTGRLPEATHRLLSRVREQYQLSIKVYVPEASNLEKLIEEQGTNGFYQSIDARKACCRVRKVSPLARALEGQEAWITGLRREQSLTRQQLEKSAWDSDHGLIKYNPLLDWSRDEVWQYVRDHHVPYNALHDQGYPSIGCEPCTRAVREGETERSGRWWWEHPETKECGLHIAQQ
ncbi:MAG: phosphoadenosine phosphosulfate reductase [Ferrovum sp. 37-45-19]|uniref:phosphoadenylyl-sulfate reductase n=1 Tax=Ferrovum sp. JA12 TaxID=1356299 RepID=UPI000702BE8F|nr:phosphoadenylyl-sulfate reductase [Ferrovum sp. JA12]OYV79867.1 MAG: phosphoadenosine phosphosulfate reductase [Ferrovum sp. 21-44-67]OYV95491.1 MAG: phosphoadenosine phosphosulfate reductase [Ferrovum sp. 37-45-19]OZB31536.1 MAG: phosphoadenosine phosphosulfate reductase [Ferrovum sp. 34-44-207]HQT81287.1 phosphoadenylyl-sulfate reductase [Ferrovaceae bacterium]KRH78175.1 thioredoxin-dependent 5'-adenylylsulfate reductase [Ferrovum sp. JA12]